MTTELLTPEEIADYKERWSCQDHLSCRHAPATHRIATWVGLQLIATLEAAWAEIRDLKEEVRWHNDRTFP